MRRLLIAIRLAFRNLRRNKRRTALTSTGLAVGLIVMIVAFSTLDGLTEQARSSIMDFEVAHIRGFPPGYLEEDLPGLEFQILHADSLRRAVSELDGVAATARLTIHGQLIAGREEAFIEIVGADLVHDPRVYRTLDQVVAGQALAPGKDGVLIGQNLAKDMKLAVGDPVTLFLRSAPGAFNSRNLHVTGIYRTSNPMIDGRQVFIPLALAQQLALMPDAANQLAVRLHDYRDAAPVRKQLRRDFPGFAWQTWDEAAADFLRTIHFRRIVFSVIIGILALIALIAVSNTMVMAVHERAREIGALRALGFDPRLVGRIFLFEGLLIGLIAGALAVIAGGAIVLWLHRHGISLGQFDDMQTGLPIRDALYPVLHLSTTLLAFIVGAFLTGLASWRAARRVTRGEVVRALREGML